MKTSKLRLVQSKSSHELHVRIKCKRYNLAYAKTPHQSAQFKNITTKHLYWSIQTLNNHHDSHEMSLAMAIICLPHHIAKGSTSWGPSTLVFV